MVFALATILSFMMYSQAASSSQSSHKWSILPHTGMKTKPLEELINIAFEIQCELNHLNGSSIN